MNGHRGPGGRRRSGRSPRRTFDRLARLGGLAVVLIALGGGPPAGALRSAAADEDPATVARRAFYAERLRKAPEGIPAIVARAKKYLASVGATFEVGYTSALDHKPEQHRPKRWDVRTASRLERNAVLRRLRDACPAAGSDEAATPLAGCDPTARAFSWDDDAHPDRDAVGPAEDQGACSSCWAFGTIAALEGSDAIRNGEGREPRILNGSEQDLLDCVYETFGWECNGGDECDALDRLVAAGCALEDAVPYQGVAGACAERDRPLRACTWGGVVLPASPTPEAIVAAVKQALCAHGPLASEIQVEGPPPEPLSGYQALDFYVGGEFDYPCVMGSTLGHLVCIVGWDDDRGAWRIKNSRGTAWGEQGFAWVRYGTCGIGEVAFWVDAAASDGSEDREPLRGLLERLRDLIRRIPRPIPEPPVRWREPRRIPGPPPKGPIPVPPPPPGPCRPDGPR